MGDCPKDAGIATVAFGFKVAESCPFFDSSQIAEPLHPMWRVCNTNLPLTGTDPRRWQIEVQDTLTANDLDFNSLVRRPFDDFLSKGDRDKKTPVRALCDDGAAI
jgi:hypothetical protein